MEQYVRTRAKALQSIDFAPLASWVTQQAIDIQQVPAPTFEEQDRAQIVAKHFTDLNLAHVSVDELCNVYGLLEVEDAPQYGILLSAHIDTVFPAGTDLTLKHENGRIYGPGLGDNSFGVAGLLGVLKFMRDQEILPRCNIWFVATSREEGLGNLDGIRAAYDRVKQDIATVINLEGLAYGYIYHAGIAVRRLRIATKAEGGHSWLHFGRASANHALIKLANQIVQIPVPTRPRTTFNIGVMEGGHSINSIATDAHLWLDMRSESNSELDKLDRHVRKIVASTQDVNLETLVEVVGERPTGSISPGHPLVQGALTALAATGVTGTLQNGSTDGNVPLADNCPTVTIGITRGGNAHRLDEFAETGPVAEGIKQAILLTLAASDYQAEAQS